MLGRAFLLTAVLLAAGAAGCLGGDEEGPGGVPGAGAGTPDEGDDMEGSPGTAPDSLTAPRWQVGDWWSWESPQLGEYTYVVTGEQGSDWIVETDNPGIAFFDALTDISFLGPVRKSDLAGSQNDTRVEFFDWPLETGKSWTTTWDGVQRTVTVQAVTDGIALLQATQGDRLAVTYTYDSATRGFGSVAFFDAGGNVSVEAQPLEAGRNWTGQVARWTIHGTASSSVTYGPTPGSATGQLPVEGNVTDLYLSFNLACTSGAYELRLHNTEDPESLADPYHLQATCPDENSFAAPVVQAPGPGPWEARFTGLSPEGESTASFTLISRSLELASFPG